MKYTRRDVLKMAGAGAGVLALGGLGVNYLVTESYTKKLKIKGAKEVITSCPYCSVICQIIAHVKGGKVVSTEGDAKYPVSEGALCAKGSAMLRLKSSIIVHSAINECSTDRFMRWPVCFYLMASGLKTGIIPA